MMFRIYNISAQINIYKIKLNYD